jgi:hypothetical protein
MVVQPLALEDSRSTRGIPTNDTPLHLDSPWERTGSCTEIPSRAHFDGLEHNRVATLRYCTQLGFSGADDEIASVSEARVVDSALLAKAAKATWRYGTAPALGGLRWCVDLLRLVEDDLGDPLL